MKRHLQQLALEFLKYGLLLLLYLVHIKVNSLLLTNYLAVGHSETMAANNLNVVTVGVQFGYGLYWVFVMLEKCSFNARTNIFVSISEFSNRI